MIQKLLSEKKSDAALVSDLYIAALCREPSETERSHALAYLSSQSERTTALEDLVWSILNLREFIFRP
jgi:hypothetical protein